jgi:hypothetical protein
LEALVNTGDPWPDLYQAEQRVQRMQTKLILRRDQIWSKTNPIPESVRDRPYMTHEYWFCSPRVSATTPRSTCYVSRTVATPSTGDRYGYGTMRFGARNGPAVVNGGRNAYHGAMHPLGRMPGSVWRLPTERLPRTGHLAAEHDAAFGPEWPRQLILGWSPPRICKACGQGHFPVTDPEFMLLADASPERSHDHDLLDPSNGWGSSPSGSTSARIVGYACGCTPFTDHPGTGQATRRRSHSPGLRDNNPQGTYGRRRLGQRPGLPLMRPVRSRAGCGAQLGRSDGRR